MCVFLLPSPTVSQPADAQIIYRVFCARMDHLALGFTWIGPGMGCINLSSPYQDRPFTNRYTRDDSCTHDDTWYTAHCRVVTHTQ